jgi:hypothetical protein
VSCVCREFDAATADVFAVLLDPASYPDWLIGARSVRDVDASWPEPGSRFHHRVGIGALTISDYTEVLAVEPESMLQLRVRARPLIAGVVTFRVIGDRERCVLVMEEEPARRVIGNLVRPQPPLAAPSQCVRRAARQVNSRLRISRPVNIADRPPTATMTVHLRSDRVRAGPVSNRPWLSRRVVTNGCRLEGLIRVRFRARG